MPIVTGQMFDEQMAYWYTPTKHQRFGSKIEGTDDWAMPGFQEVLRLYEIGQFWDVSDKSFPWFYVSEGQTFDIMYEWYNYWNADGDRGIYTLSFDKRNIRNSNHLNVLTGRRILGYCEDKVHLYRRGVIYSNT